MQSVQLLIPVFASWAICRTLGVLWAIDGAVLFHFAGTLSQNPDVSRAPGSTIAKLLALVGLLIVVSFTFWLTGNPTRALWIAGAPMLAIGVFFGAWCILLVTVGRNERWN